MNIPQNDTVSNQQFLEAIFKDQWPRAHLTAFPEPPDKAGGGAWTGFSAGAVQDLEAPNLNWYYTVSLFKLAADGSSKRTKDLFDGQYALVLDDLGSGPGAKIPMSAMEGKPLPQYSIETSPDNWQIVYIFKSPVHDGELMGRVIDAMISQGLSATSDPGFKGVTRYVRLPNAINNKSKYGDVPFNCRILPVAPDVRYNLVDIITGWGLQLSESKGGRATSTPAAVEQGFIFKTLTQHDLWSGAQGNGFWGTPCPQEHLHTIDDGRTGYNVETGEFKCMHGSCENLNQGDLDRWLKQQYPEDAGEHMFPGFKEEDKVHIPTIYEKQQDLVNRYKALELTQIEEQHAILFEASQVLDPGTSLNGFIIDISAYTGEGKKVIADTIKGLKKKAGGSGTQGGSVAGFDGFNESHAIVKVSGKVLVMDLNNYISSSVNDVAQFTRNLPSVMNGDKPEPFFQYWMEHPARTTCIDAVFDPSLPPGINGDLFNFYRGMSVVPVQGDWSLIAWHLKYIWCGGNDAVYEYLLNWVAAMVQRPWEPAGSVIALGDKAEGAGTGVITDMFVRWFSHHSMVGTRFEDVTGRFNSKQALSIFILLNEAVWGGSKQQQGVLKAITTDTEQMMEKKGLEKIMVPNCAHMMISSNEFMHAALGMDDRRYLILECSAEKKGNREYFKALFAQTNGGGSAAFLYAMMTRDLTGYFSGDIPRHATTKRAGLKLQGMSLIEKWIVEFTEHGDTVSQGPRDKIGVHTWLNDYANNRVVDWEQEGLVVNKRTMVEDCIEYTREPTTANAITRELHKMLGMPTREVKRGPSGDQKRVYVLPSLPECRAAVIARMGGDSPYSD